MIEIICQICEKRVSLPNYRKDAKFCSFKCKGVSTRDRMKGNKLREGCRAWNKGMKGIHLSPASEFKKGVTPWNKDMKGIHLSPDSEFQPGTIPKNKVSVGTITKRTDSNGKSRNYIKIDEPNVWETLYRYRWIQKYGTITEGMVLHHVNFVSDDDDLKNIIMVTRQEHINLHRQHLYGKK